MKRTLLLSVALAISMALFGCGSSTDVAPAAASVPYADNTESLDGTATDVLPSEAVPDEAAGGDSISIGAESNAQDDPVSSDSLTSSPTPLREVFWEHSSLADDGGKYQIINATSFSDGVAWITIAKNDVTSSDKHTMLINTDGEVLFEAPQQDNSGYTYCNFAKGVSWLRSRDDCQLVNNKGEIVWSLQNDGYRQMEEIYGDGSVDEITLGFGNQSEDGLLDIHPVGTDNNLFTGYTIATIAVNTWENSGVMFSILKPDGTWLFEPVPNISHGHKRGGIELKYIYGAYAEWPSEKNDKTCNKINLTTGEITRDADLAHEWEEEYQRSIHDNLLYDTELNGFTDNTGNLVIDLSEYTFTHKGFVPEFNNGYCVLMVDNPDGAHYIAVIDTSGSRVFTPIKFPSDYTSVCRGGVSDGKHIVLYNNGVQKNMYFYGMDGEAIKTDYEQIFPFSDGYALVSKMGEYRLTYHFIDENLKEAFLH